MIHIRKSSEDEMICEYLKAEFGSERFSKEIKNKMSDLFVEDRIILSPDITKADENEQRKNILSAFRGYGLNQQMFERFPSVSDWSLCCFSEEDIENIRYINYSYWNELSGGTKLPLAAAETIRNGISIYGQDNNGFEKAAEYIKSGGTFAKMFFLTADYEKYVIVEGHLRMTAYALVPECFHDIEVIVGKCNRDELDNWM